MTIERILTPQSLDAPLMAFDVATMISEMKAEPTWEAASRNAMTLLKDHALRIVLVVMRAGTSIARHRAEGPIAVQVLEGELRFTAGSQELSLRPGRLVTVAAGVPHGVLAMEDAAFLLSVSSEGTHPAEKP